MVLNIVRSMCVSGNATLRLTEGRCVLTGAVGQVEGTGVTSAHACRESSDQTGEITDESQMMIIQRSGEKGRNKSDSCSSIGCATSS